MTKDEIIQEFLRHLKNKNHFLRMSKNNYFKFVKEEALFQYFIIAILRQNNFFVVINNHESNKTPYERYLTANFGNVKGLPDLIVFRNGNRPVFLEVKKSIDEVYTKKHDFRANSHIKEQVKVINDLTFDHGVIAFFVYPENVKKVFGRYFNISL